MSEDLGDEARKSIEKSLLEYCELDTLAMVFLYQGLTDLIAIRGSGDRQNSTE